MDRCGQDKTFVEEEQRWVVYLSRRLILKQDHTSHYGQMIVRLNVGKLRNRRSVVGEFRGAQTVTTKDRLLM